MDRQSRKVIPISAGLSSSGEQEEIVELAFEAWLARRFRGGSPEQALFWAEREVRRRSAMSQRRPAGLFLVRDSGA